MINKSVLPLKFDVPVLGDTIFLTRGLKYNIEFLLFWGPWAPFDHSWHLHDDYKSSNRRKELGKRLAKIIGYIGNLFLIHFIKNIQFFLSQFFFIGCRNFKFGLGAVGVVVAAALRVLQLR